MCDFLGQYEQVEGEGKGRRAEQGEGEATTHREHQKHQSAIKGITKQLQNTPP